MMKVDFCQRNVQNLKSNIGWYGKTERHKVGVVTYRREVNQMSDCDKAAVYETFLIDLFQVFSCIRGIFGCNDDQERNDC